MMSPCLGQGRGSRWPTGHPQVPASVQQALGLLGAGPHQSLGPGLGLSHPGTQGQYCQEQVAQEKGPAASPGGRGNATFVSCSHLALAPREGAEAAAKARPRPPGIFERCSWVPGGWQTWQRRVGQAPKPTTKKGGGWTRREEGGCQAPGHSAASPRTPGAPARLQPRQQPALWMGNVAWPPCWGCLAIQAAPRSLESRRPKLLGIEAALFPCWALQSSGRQPAPACFPSGSQGPHYSLPPLLQDS